MRNYLCAIYGYNKVAFCHVAEVYLHRRGAFGCKRIAFCMVRSDDGGGSSVGKEVGPIIIVHQASRGGDQSWQQTGHKAVGRVGNRNYFTLFP